MAWVTLEEIKDELCIDDDNTQFDAYLTRKRNSICAAIESYCRRSFLASDEDETYDFPQGIILLKKFPIISVADVLIDGVSSTEFYVDTDTGRLYYQDDNQYDFKEWSHIYANQSVQIQYRGGFEQVSFPEDLRDVVFSMVQQAYLNRDRDTSQKLKFEAIPQVISTAYYDSSKLHPTFGAHVDVINKYASERGMLP